MFVVCCLFRSALRILQLKMLGGDIVSIAGPLKEERMEDRKDTAQFAEQEGSGKKREEKTHGQNNQIFNIMWYMVIVSGNNNACIYFDYVHVISTTDFLF